MSKNSHQKPDASKAAEHELCVQCLEPNLPGSHFCAKCGAPMSAYAATGPFEALFAEGNAYRRAAEQPRRFIVVAGVWVIFGVGALAGIGMAIGSGESISARVSGSAVGVISLLIIGKTTWNYWRHQLGKATAATGLDPARSA
jgi:hypothetical protein